MGGWEGRRKGGRKGIGKMVLVWRWELKKKKEDKRVLERDWGEVGREVGKKKK